jgi:hypothetical protein
VIRLNRTCLELSRGGGQGEGGAGWGNYSMCAHVNKRKEKKKPSEERLAHSILVLSQPTELMTHSPTYSFIYK